MQFNNQQSIYLQIGDMICEKILLKQFTEDERIPSVREMAVQLEVNPNTVMRTYEYLQSKEIIINKRGVGFFVSAEGIKRVTDMKKTEFIEEELPKIFRTAQLLGISIDQLQKQFELFINQPDKP